MTEGSDYEKAVKENKDRDLSIRANAPRLTWWARWSSIGTPALIDVQRIIDAIDAKLMEPRK